jgi:hypothetical protein
MYYFLLVLLISKFVDILSLAKNQHQKWSTKNNFDQYRGAIQGYKPDFFVDRPVP